MHYVMFLLVAVASSSEQKLVVSAEGAGKFLNNAEALVDQTALEAGRKAKRKLKLDFMAKTVVVTSALDALGKYNPADAYDAVGGTTSKMLPRETMETTGKCYTRWIIKNCAQRENWGGSTSNPGGFRNSEKLAKYRNRMQGEAWNRDHDKPGEAWSRLCPFLAHFEANMTADKDYYVYRNTWDGAMAGCKDEPMCKLIMCKQPAIATVLSKPIAPYGGSPEDKVTPWWNAQQAVCVTGPDGKAYSFTVFVQCAPVWKASQCEQVKQYNSSYCRSNKRCDPPTSPPWLITLNFLGRRSSIPERIRIGRNSIRTGNSVIPSRNTMVFRT